MIMEYDFKFTLFLKQRLQEWFIIADKASSMKLVNRLDDMTQSFSQEKVVQYLLIKSSFIYNTEMKSYDDEKLVYRCSSVRKYAMVMNHL